MWPVPPIVALVDTCVRCGADLGVGRFCLNCGHPIGEPAPAIPAAVEPVLPVQAADPTAAPEGATVPAAVIAPGPDPARWAEPPTPREPAWDPREELLPYEEVDERDLDDPVPGRAWIFWVLGAVLLVGLVVVLLRAFGTDEDDVAATDATSSESSAPSDEGSGTGSAAPEESGSPAPKGVGKPLNLALAASVEVPGTAPPTTDLDGTLVAYEAGQMHDGNPSTTWRIAGDASGQTVTITLAEPGVVTRVGLVNGYAKQVAGVDWYPNNRRILSVTWGFDDGSTVEQTFAERPQVQLLKVPPVQTSAVSIAITSVTPPGPGDLGRDYTAISEVVLTGRRAG